MVSTDPNDANLVKKTMPFKDHHQDVFNEILLERVRQNDKFGPQKHCPKTWLMILGEEIGEVNKAVLEVSSYSDGRLVSINAEMLKAGKGCYREELIQSAAVIFSMLECLDKDTWLK